MNKIYALLFVAFLTASTAQAEVGYPSAYLLFKEACLQGAMTTSARETAIAASGEWRFEGEPDFDLKEFGRSPKGKNFLFWSAITQRQWTRQIEGKKIRLILATFPEKQKYHTLCAMILPGKEKAMEYHNAFDPDVVRLGLKARSIDIPHYFNYSGKIEGDKNVQMEIFSRSAILEKEPSMHFFVIF